MLAIACASPPGDAIPEAPSADRTLQTACSRFNPSMQTASLQAMVYGGGPLAVDVKRWMCGHGGAGLLIRIVFIQYHDLPAPDGELSHDHMVPVVFENGRLAAFGWPLLERDPERYGARIPLPGEPWISPPGWIVVDF